MRQLDGGSPQQGARARSRLGSVRPHLLSAIGSAQAQNGFSTKHRHVGLFPKNGRIWRYLFQPGMAPASTLLTNCYPRGRCSCRYKVLCAGPQGLSTGL